MLDESGSVCSKQGYVRLCTGAGTSSSCEYNGQYSKKNELFCPKFNTNTKNFVKSFMTSMDESASSWGASTKYAVSTFSSNADQDQDLQDTATTVNTVTNLDYEGGYTQTAQGMETCQNLLLKGDPNADKLLVLVTDGRPRLDGSDPKSYFGETKSYATNIKSGRKAAGGGNAPAMKIIAIGVKTTESDMSFVQDLASPGHSIEITEGYDALEGKVNSIVSGAIGSSCGDISGRYKKKSSLECLFVSSFPHFAVYILCFFQMFSCSERCTQSATSSSIMSKIHSSGILNFY